MRSLNPNQPIITHKGLCVLIDNVIQTLSKPVTLSIAITSSITITLPRAITIPRAKNVIQSNNVIVKV